MPILGWIQFIPTAFKIGRAASDLLSGKGETFEKKVIRINDDQAKYKGLTVSSDGDIITISYQHKKFKFTVEHDS